MCFGSLRTSISSGTLVCIWKAISYWLMRVAISGSRRLFVLEAVEGLHRVDEIALRLRGDAGRDFEIKHGIAHAAEFDSLKAARQKTRVPLPRGDRLLDAEFARGNHHHEAGQRLGVVPQAVPEPRAHAPAGRRSSSRCS